MTPPTTIRFSSQLERSRSKLWGHQIRVPKRVADLVADTLSRRVWCSLNGTPERQCALIPIGGGSFVLTVNKELQKKNALTPGTSVKVTLRRDETQYGLPMPVEFAELLRQDKEGETLIHALTPGKLRTLIYIVGKGKNADQRIERALIIVRHLKENGGKINYRQLGQELMNGRRRLPQVPYSPLSRKKRLRPKRRSGEILT